MGSNHRATPSAISLHGATKDYRHGRGVFDLTLDVARGEVVGYLGANGAGKTVTMRMLMGFVKPGKGTVRIAGRDCFSRRPEIQAHVGYLPGEVACPPDMRGRSFLRLVADMKHVRDRRGIDELVERFELDPTARMGKMSKGTRQKVALVAAFMGDPEILLLDEPTSGLDPVMQARFVELVRERHAAGATILLSSHVFEEVGRVCDRVALIRAGHLRAVRSMEELRRDRRRRFEVTFADASERVRYMRAHLGSLAAGTASAEVEVTGAVGDFLKDLAEYRVSDLASREQTLEELFRHIYDEDSEALA